MAIDVLAATDPNAVGGDPNAMTPPYDPFAGVDSGAAGAVINRHTDQPYGARGTPATKYPNVLASKGSVHKPGFANMDVPQFSEFVPAMAKADGVDLATADDKTILGYADKYAQHMVPQALMAGGFKVDKDYLKSLPFNVRYQVSQQLPALRAYWKGSAPAAPDATVDNGQGTTFSDYPTDLAGEALKGAGPAIGGTINSMTQQTPDILGGPALLAARAVGAAAPDSMIAHGVNTFDALKNFVAQKASIVGDTISKSFGALGDNVLSSESPAFKKAAAEPITDDAQPWTTPDGVLNPKKFNGAAFGPTSLFHKTLGTAAEFALPVIASALTKNPAPLVALGGAQGGQQAREASQSYFQSLTPEQWQQLPAFHVKTQQGMDPATAKQSIENETIGLQTALGNAGGAVMGLAAELPWLRPAAGNMLTRITANYAKQAPLFAGLAAGQTAATTAAQNLTTGTNKDVLAGTVESGLQAAVGAAPFAVGGGFAKSPEKAAVPKPGEVPPPTAGEPPAPGAPPATPAGVVPDAVTRAFEEHPIPAPATPGAPSFADPIQAQAHYQQAIGAFRGDLAGEGLNPAAVEAAIPAFNEAWQRQSGVDPTTFGAAPAEAAPPTPPAPGETPPPSEAPPSTSELDAAAAAVPTEDPLSSAADSMDFGDPVEPGAGAAARAAGELPAVPTDGAADVSPYQTVEGAAALKEAMAADHIPEGLRTRVAKDLKKSLGREPSPMEVAKQGEQLLNLALSQDGVDFSIPRSVLEEAAGNLMASGKESPGAADINKAARSLRENPAQQGIQLQDSLALEPPAGGDVLAKGFKAIKDREDAALRAALEKKKVDTEEAQKIADAQTRTRRQAEIDDAYKTRVAQETASAERARQNAHASRERENAIAEEEQRKADLEAGKRKNVLKDKLKIKGKDRKDALAKKADAVPQESGAATTAAEEPALNRADHEKVVGEEEQTATPEEAASLKPLEDFYNKHSNVESALRDMVGKIKSEPLRNLINRILANPYLVERLKNEPLQVRNPTGKGSKPGETPVGNFLVKRRNSAGGVDTFRESRWGEFHPKRGVTLAGRLFKPRGAIDNGLHPITFIHEAVHAAISHIINGVKSGAIKDPALVSAYHELEAIRKVLSKYAEGTTTDKDTLSALRYAATGDEAGSEHAAVHELVSVAMTDPRVQTALSRIKMGTVNAWQRLMGIFNRMLGGTPEDVSALTRIMELSHRFIDYKPEGFVPESDRALGSQRSDKVEANTPEKVMESSRIKSPAEAVKENNAARQEQGQPTRAQEIQIKIFDKLKALTFLKEALLRKGIKLSPKEDMEIGARVYQANGSRVANTSHYGINQPAINDIVAFAKSKGLDPAEFLTNLDVWYKGKHAIERNLRGELEDARLTKDAAIKRQEIRDQWAAGKLPDGQYIEALKKVVGAPGARVANRSPLYQSGMTDELAYEMVARARKAGITPEAVAMFEPHRKRMLDFTTSNLQKAGTFSPDEEMMRSGIGYKYYVPFKGMGGEDASFKGTSPGAFTSEYTGAKGRVSNSDNAIVRLMQDVVRGARAVPENEFTKTIYAFAKKHGADLGIKVRTYDHDQMVKDAIAAGKGLDEVSKVFKNENAVIHNNGKYRYSIEFPPDSAALKAIKGINQTPELNAVQRVIGGMTNLIARGATTLQPAFLLWNAFWRDMGYVGAQVGMDLGPAAAAEYAARYWMKGGPLGGRPTYFSGLRPRNALERDVYAATSNSGFAKSLAEMAKHGGDLSFENELNNVRNMDEVHASLVRASRSNMDPRALAHTALRFLDQIGTSDIMTARVAAYDTYKSVATKKLGRAPTPEEALQIQKDGAMFSRRILDYQQRSDVSRSWNIAYPFLRVVLNQTDRLHTTFKNPDGSFNYKKAAAAAGVGMMAGATYYALLRQAYPDIKKEDNGTLATNFTIPIGGGKVVKIPMAYGLTRLMLVPGMMMARAALGDSSNEDAANEIRNAIAEAVTPFKPPHPSHNENAHQEIMDFVTAMTPGVARPIVELERNKNAFGTAITPNDLFVHGPHSEAGKPATPEFWKGAAQTLKHLGVDVYPESLEYLTQAYGTGPGNALLRFIAMGDNASKGKDTDPTKLPFMPSVLSKDADFYERRRLSEIKQDLEDKGKIHLSEKETEDLKAVNSSARRFNIERKAVNGNALMDAKAKQKQIEEINTRQAAENKTLLQQIGDR